MANPYSVIVLVSVVDNKISVGSPFQRNAMWHKVEQSRNILGNIAVSHIFVRTKHTCIFSLFDLSVVSLCKRIKCENLYCSASFHIHVQVVGKVLYKRNQTNCLLNRDHHHGLRFLRAMSHRAIYKQPVPGNLQEEPHSSLTCHVYFLGGSET